MKVSAAWLPALAGFALSSALAAQSPPPLGAEFPIDTNTANLPEAPAVAADGTGHFMVVWDSSGTDGDNLGVLGQRYDFSAQKSGALFQVNTYTTGNQYTAHVAGAANGNFVVVWDSYGQDGSKSGVFGQRFGVKPPKIPILPGTFVEMGNEFQVNTTTSLVQFEPSAAMDAAGNFVVVWYGDGDFGGGGVWSPFAQRFDASGNKLGGPFAVTADTSTAPAPVGLAMTGRRDFVAVWSRNNSAPPGVFGQRFDASGAKVGDAFQINSSTTGYWKDPRVAIDDRGNFVVVWSNSSLGPPDVVSGQWFNSSAEKVGPEFAVSAFTTGGDGYPWVALGDRDSFVVVWDGYRGARSVLGQRFDRLGGKIGAEFVVASATSTTYDVFAGGVAQVAGGLVAVYSRPGHDFTQGVFGRGEDRIPVGISVDSRSANGTTSDANGVLEPGETVFVAPVWTNRSGLAFGDFGGFVASFSGPGGPTYAAPVALADYGPMPSGSVASCDDGSPDACYRLQVSGPRPATHWDATLDEGVSFGGGHLWNLHVGDSFTDVPRSQPFYKKIETLLHNGIGAGCSATQYCPGQTVTRDQMSIFIARALAGQGEFVPRTGSVSGIVFGSKYDCSAAGNSLFTDVKPTDSFCRHAHYLAAQQVTLGCGNFQYCPGAPVTRDAMASFIAKALVAPDGGGAVPTTYTDPATSRSYSCASGSPNLHFTDVPVSNAFCKHIHYLWAKGIVDGCTATTYCPSAPVARDAMAKFIGNGFGLQLYGP